MIGSIGELPVLAVELASFKNCFKKASRLRAVSGAWVSGPTSGASCLDSWSPSDRQPTLTPCHQPWEKAAPSELLVFAVLESLLRFFYDASYSLICLGGEFVLPRNV